MHRTHGVVRVSFIVRDHADRRAAAVQLTQQPHHSFAVLGVEVAGWFVSKQDRRSTDEGARYGNALLLTAGKLRGVMLHAMGHLDPLKRLLHALLAFNRIHIAKGQGQLHVLIDGKVSDQIKRLKDETQFLDCESGSDQQR